MFTRSSGTGVKMRNKRNRNNFIGKETEVLFEEQKEIGGEVFQTGHTKQYVKVAKRTGEKLDNRMIQGTVRGFLTDDILLMD